MDHSGHKHAYLKLALMAGLSFISMYILMYAMVDRFANVFPNVNQFYMAGLMTAPMVLIEVLLMGAMYPNRTVNLTIIAISIVALGAFWFAIRQQTGVSDIQFLRSMIPHHAGAVLMCKNAALQDGEIKRLCQTIIRGQNDEIAQMQKKLQALER
jgi:hypothetical protein